MGPFFIVLVTNLAIFDISFFPLKYNTMNVTFMCPRWLWTMILAVALAWGLWRHKYRVAALDMINR